MRLRRHPLVIAAVAMGVAAPVAAAQPIPVTTTADTVAADGVTSLREAFATASGNAEADVITLQPGATYTLTQCAAGALTHAPPQDLTIVGAGATVSQSCADDAVMTGTGADSLLTLQSMTLDGGPNSAGMLGAGVGTKGRMLLEGVTVTGVNTGNGGSVLWADGDDPGIDITVTDGALTGNDSTGITLDGGGVTVTGSTISGNTGSGISMADGSPLTITDSEVTGNGRLGVRTTGMGTTTVAITDSLIADNGDTGFTCSACSDIDITGTTIEGNGAAPAGSGGGVYWTVDQEPSSLGPRRLDITNSLVRGNRATGPGGGIFVGIVESSAPNAPSPILAITNSGIWDNRTEGTAKHGGGIAMLTGSLAIGGGSSLVNNRAGVGGRAGSSNGGGIYMQEAANDGVTDPHDMQLGGVTFDVNQASGSGGAIYVRTEGIVDLAGNDFFSSTASVRGGAIDAGAGLDVRDALFDDNSAPRGGAMYVSRFGRSGGLTIAGSTFVNNFATVAGGALMIDDTRSASVARSTFTENAAPRGGAIQIGIDPMDEPELLRLSDATLVANAAATGAAVAADEGQLSTRRVLVAAPAGGGANCAVPAGSLTPLGRSYLSDATCGVHATDLVSPASPLLGPLADNGGPTPTMLPGAGSPVRNLVPVADCPVGALDQRGVTRPQGAGCEPGAAEVGATP